MRKIKKFSSVLRVIGIVLLSLSLVLLIYSTTTDRGDWAKFRQKLAQKESRQTLRTGSALQCLLNALRTARYRRLTQGCAGGRSQQTL